MELSKLRHIPHQSKLIIILSADVLLSIITTYLAFAIRFEKLFIPLGAQYYVFVLSIIIFLIIFPILKVYKTAIQYDDINVFISYLYAFTIYLIIFYLLVHIIPKNQNISSELVAFSGIPRSIPIIQSLIFFLSFFFLRVIAKILIYPINSNKSASNNYLVYGIKEDAILVARSLITSQYNFYGFIYDHKNLTADKILNFKIYPINEIKDTILKYNITDIIIADKNLDKEKRNSIILDLINYKVKVRSSPNLVSIFDGTLNISELKEINPIDLISRKTSNYNKDLMEKKIKGKNVLVTGAGGSIGSELTRKVINQNPKQLVILDNNEYALYKIHFELTQNKKNGFLKNTVIHPMLVSINDQKNIEKILSDYSIETIYHAAAYKHVPMIESNKIQGIENNVMGTYTLVSASIKYDVSDFVLISTDKAVKPTNVMGASKRIAEQVVQAMNSSDENKKKTKFSIVRFGNVLDSSGSVIPLFRDQIKNGGPITLTSYDVTRYFMTIPEAAELVIQASGLASGGEVFVLNMGKPIKIFDIAKRCIELSGLTLKDESNPNGDIEISIIGLRPGEKLHEELLIGKNPQETFHPDILRAIEEYYSIDKTQELITELSEIIKNNSTEKLRNYLFKNVEGYMASTFDNQLK